MSTYFSSLRWSIYESIHNGNGGTVSCFCCGKSVKWEDASLEHKWPKYFGGGDDWLNLAISHTKCNYNRGNGFHRVLGNKQSYGELMGWHITCPYVYNICIKKRLIPIKIQ